MTKMSQVLAVMKRRFLYKMNWTEIYTDLGISQSTLYRIRKSEEYGKALDIIWDRIMEAYARGPPDE